MVNSDYDNFYTHRDTDVIRYDQAESARLGHQVKAKRARKECFKCGGPNDKWGPGNEGSDICSACAGKMLSQL